MVIYDEKIEIEKQKNEISKELEKVSSLRTSLAKEDEEKKQKAEK